MKNGSHRENSTQDEGMVSRMVRRLTKGSFDLAKYCPPNFLFKLRIEKNKSQEGSSHPSQPNRMAS